ncbi:Uncharacterised protein [Vibrio cholerae]|nr:Uncharacterised protein [Vibrio cholerae]
MIHGSLLIIRGNTPSAGAFPRWECGCLNLCF